jgi:hypothetical protein
LISESFLSEISTVLALKNIFLTGLTYKQLGFWTNDNAVRQLVLSYSALNPGILPFALSMAFGTLFAIFNRVERIVKCKYSLTRITIY